MRNWTRRSGGFDAAEFRITVTLSRDDYEAMKRQAREEGVTIRNWLKYRAEEGIYHGLETEDTEEESGLP